MMCCPFHGEPVQAEFLFRHKAPFVQKVGSVLEMDAVKLGFPFRGIGFGAEFTQFELRFLVAGVEPVFLRGKGLIFGIQLFEVRQRPSNPFPLQQLQHLSLPLSDTVR